MPSKPGSAARPNILLLITDQQRRPRHWPDDPGWLAELMPNEAELGRTAITFRNAFCNAAMCSPSRATLFTGLYPAQHGVNLTLTAADLQPDPKNTPGVVAEMRRILQRRKAPPRRVLRGFARGALRLGTSRGNETELPRDLPNLATRLRAAGYEVAYKGKWHLTHPGGGPGALLGGWSQRDAERIERDYGFAAWEAPDAGENAKAANFGGGNAGEGEGWDEVYTRQVESWLSQADLPEPFCLVVSLVNPHDVLGYPASYEPGGYSREEFSDLGVGLPPTIDENLAGKPGVHSLMRMGMAAYLGPLRDRAQQLDYVNFYAHLHRVVDAKIGRILGALGEASDPGSLRSRTVIVRTSDHGEMGLSHGGLRQKAFNAYEETINVPIVVSNPTLFPQPAETDALASHVDILPTLLGLAGAEAAGQNGTSLRGHDLAPVIADAAQPERERLSKTPVDLSPVTDHPAPAKTVQASVHFTFDDHQAGTAMTEAPGQPNRVRAVRTASEKYVLYLDPKERVAPEYEMYDLDRDPDETDNRLDVHLGTALERGASASALDLRERLDAAMAAAGTDGTL